MSNEQKQVGWSFIVWWTGLTLIGGFASVYLGFEPLGGKGVAFSVDLMNYLHIYVSLGLVLVSLAQWILLRRYIPNSAWWIVTGVVGFALGILSGKAITQILFYSYNVNDFTWLALTYVTISGTVFGIFQWIYLRYFHTRTVWWILVNAMLGPVAWMLGFTVPIMGYAFRGIVSGSLLFWILQQPKAEQSEDSSLSTTKVSVGLGLWILLGIALILSLVEGNRSSYELYLSVSSLVGGLVGSRTGKKGLKRAIYGWAIGILAGSFIWVFGTCQFCQ